MIIRKLDDIISDVLTKSRVRPAEYANPDYIIDRVTDATVLVLKETSPDFIEGIKIKQMEYTPEGGKVGIKFRWVFEDEIVTHENHSSGIVTIKGSARSRLIVCSGDTYEECIGDAVKKWTTKILWEIAHN